MILRIQVFYEKDKRMFPTNLPRLDVFRLLLDVIGDFQRFDHSFERFVVLFSEKIKCLKNKQKFEPQKPEQLSPVIDIEPNPMSQEGRFLKICTFLNLIFKIISLKTTLVVHLLMSETRRE